MSPFSNQIFKVRPGGSDSAPVWVYRQSGSVYFVGENPDAWRGLIRGKETPESVRLKFGGMWIMSMAEVAYDVDPVSLKATCVKSMYGWSSAPEPPPFASVEEAIVASAARSWPDPIRLSDSVLGEFSRNRAIIGT